MCINVANKKLSHLLGFQINSSNELLYQQVFELSSKSKKKTGNDRLEFLGDSVLNLIVSEYIFKEKAEFHSGFLTEMKAKLTNRKFLNELASKWGLKDLIHQSTNRVQTSKDVCGDTLEALIAALYLDKGFRFSYSFVMDLIQKHQNISSLEKNILSYKQVLLQKCQKYKTPYHLAYETSNHLHKVILMLGKKEGNLSQHYTGSATSIKEAEETACKKAYSYFKFEKIL